MTETRHVSIARLSDTASTFRLDDELGVAFETRIHHEGGDWRAEAEKVLARRGYSVTGQWAALGGLVESWSATVIVTQVDLACGECDQLLITEEPGRVVCGNGRCPDFGMGKEIWMAQRRRVERGKDLPAPGPGWPRPILDGRPHPWVTPVSDGLPWWRLTDGERMRSAQNGWRCQLCGELLDERAWVVLDGARVVTSAALHRRCLDLAVLVCSHLSAADGYRQAEVTRADLLGDGHPLPERGAAWWQQWTLCDAGIQACAEPLDTRGSGPVGEVVT